MRFRANFSLLFTLLLVAGCSSGNGGDSPGPGGGGNPPGNGGGSISSCQIFPSDNPWNRDVSQDPVDPNSADYLATMNAGSRFLHPDFGSNPDYGLPYTTVGGNQARVPV